MVDELNAPLGLDQERRGGSRVDYRKLGLFVLGSALVAAAYVAFILSPRDPYAGEPHAIARIEPAKPSEPVSPPAPKAAMAPVEDNGARKVAARDGLSEAGEMEKMSGVKVTRNGGGETPPGPLIIRVERPEETGLAAAPDKRLVEKGRYGPLPKIGADGAKPMDVYARPLALRPRMKDAPRIALVVGGMGLNSSATNAAIEQLPEEVTLAFAPYGETVGALAAQARDRGHEILLQAPMEPFDYRQNNPGPHTLRAGAPVAAELDDLHWLMSRFVGYAGVMNFLGARFTADEKALAPALKEIADRGLFFLDDGTSPQSLAATAASRQSSPFARVDVVIDAEVEPAAIDKALMRLEARARRQGVAIGFANALPVTVDRVARFARGLEQRGVALAPVTAVLARPSVIRDMRTAPQR
jgi:polysaccharide deacetylase 2 family uncharacterized protein YibQ